MEIWKDIEGYEGRYQVSNMGNIKGLRRSFGNLDHAQLGKIKRFKKERILKPLLNNKNKYSYIQLSTESKVKACRIHRLVAQAFIPNPENKPSVNHIDGNKSNNRVDNLEWATDSENARHAVRNNLIGSGERSYLAKITLETARYIKNSNKSVRELCNELNLKYAHVYNLRKGLIWKNQLENSLKQ